MDQRTYNNKSNNVMSKSMFAETDEMKDDKKPNPNTIYPIPGYDKDIYVKPTINNPNIIVGDFTYIADGEFESHVTHHLRDVYTPI